MQFYRADVEKPTAYMRIGEALCRTPRDHVDSACTYLFRHLSKNLWIKLGEMKSQKAEKYNFNEKYTFWLFVMLYNSDMIKFGPPR